MNHNYYVTYLLNPFDTNKYIIIGCDETKKISKLTLEDLSLIDSIIISHDIWRLIDLYRYNNIDLPKCLLEINQIEKYITGKPSSDFSNEKPWDTISILKNRCDTNNSDTVKDFKKIIWGGGFEKDETELFNLLSFVLVEIINYINEINVDKFSTYIEHELPVANIIYKSQYKGISFNESKINEFLDDLEYKYYSKLSELSDTYDFNGNIFNTEYLISYIKENKIDHIEYLNEYGISKFIDYLSDLDERILKIRELRRLYVSKSILLKMISSSTNIIHPIFDCIGTVTGRIIAIEPVIQHLKKEYRSILTASDNNKLLYIDYSSFEPRILASLTEDKELNRIISNDDLYETISKIYFLGKLDRAIAKLLFLQFSYGASVNTMAYFISKKSDIDMDTSISQINNMIDSFKEIKLWKKTIVDRLKDNPIITAGHGILRNFQNKDINSYLVQRQAVNHIVQASGASLLKELIIEINEKFPMANILLPMHDAILLEIPTQEYDNIAENISSTFISVFQNSFPESKIEVEISQF